MEFDAEMLRATRSYFDLGELPLSIKATPTKNGVEIFAVGIPQINLLASIERAFQNRHFWIVDASVSSRKGLFMGTFELQLVKDAEGLNLPDSFEEGCNEMEAVKLDVVGESEFENTPIKRYDAPNKDYTACLQDIRFTTPPKKYDLKNPPAAKVVLAAEDGCDARVKTSSGLAKVDREAFRDGATIRLTIVRKWCKGLRPALLHMVSKAGFQVVMARLSFAKSFKDRTIKDTFWLAVDKEGGREDKDSSAADCEAPEWLSQLSTQLQGVSPEKFCNDSFRETEGTEQFGYKSNKKLERERAEAVEGLPPSLRRLAQELPYRLRQVNDGLEFDGLAKVCGAGMGTSAEGRNIIEFRSYFTRSEFERSTSTFLSFLSAFTASRKPFAEFVTQYDPVADRLTVFKVFLNGVLPSGKRAGVRAAAEQLLRIPVVGNDTWNGVAAILRLKELHLCDVVNWNTYAILSQIGHSPDNETERWLLNQELASAGLKMEDLISKPVETVFVSTVLGKFVRGMLEEWRRDGLAQHTVQSVTVEMKPSKYELILGEYRPVMDVVVRFGKC